MNRKCKGEILINTHQVPIKYKGFPYEHIKIECEIHSADNNYSKIFDLVMDTGATISGISEDVAIQLGYDPSDPQYLDDVDTAGGIEEKLPIIEIVMINVHGLKLKQPKVLCNKYFDDINIHGVIGLDFLTQYNLKIIFDNELMKTYKRKEIIITP